jgi:hypothetical protein
MQAVPITQGDPGFINCVVHSLTGAQVLYYLFHTWSQEPDRSVIIWCEKGETLAKMNAIRVALAKERKARGLPRTFELKFSESWPHTHLGIKGEAIKVERIGGTMQTRMRAAFLSLSRGGHGNGG